VNLHRWTVSLNFFPSDDTSAEDLVSDAYNSLNSYLQEVSPRVVIGEDGKLQRGWYYRNLMQAMYIMLYLDLTGGNAVKKCQRSGDPNYFRMGLQESKYCSIECANHASTRMWRGQKP
jgi:hypothetical protein